MRLYTYIFLLTLITVSCKRPLDYNNDNIIILSINNIKVDFAFKDITVTVKTIDYWEAKTNNKWLTITKLNDTTLSVLIDINSDNQTRKGVITINTTEISKPITIIQSAITNPKLKNQTLDSLALVLLYKQNDGKKWYFAAEEDTPLMSTKNQDERWDFNNPFDTWRGVETTIIGGRKRLTSLDLSSRGVAGNIANDVIVLWSELKEFIAPFNMLTTTDLKNLTTLNKLQQINLSNNSVKGVIPPEITNLRKLIVLNLSYNLLTGEMPQNFHLLQDLEVLALAYNQGVNFDFQSIRKNNKLQTIDLSGTNIDEIIPSYISNFTNLTHLKLSQTKLFGTIPQSFSNLKNIISINISDNKLTSVHPQALQNPELQFLNLSHNQIKGNLVLNKLPEIETIVLSNNQIDGLGNWSNLTEITDVYLENNELQSLPEKIENSPKLNVLSAFNNNITTPLPDFSGVTNLTTIRLHDNQFVGTIGDWVGRLKKLRTLNLYKNNLTGNLPPSIVQAVNLYYLNVSENKLSGTLSPIIINDPRYSGIKNVDDSDMKLPSWNPLKNILPQKNSYGLNPPTF